MRLVEDWNTLDNNAKKRIAKAFQEALAAQEAFWYNNKDNIDNINDYLENDLKRFPNQIKEHMQSMGVEVE